MLTHRVLQQKYGFSVHQEKYQLAAEYLPDMKNKSSAICRLLEQYIEHELDRGKSKAQILSSLRKM